MLIFVSVVEDLGLGESSGEGLAAGAGELEAVGDAEMLGWGVGLAVTTVVSAKLRKLDLPKANTNAATIRINTTPTTIQIPVLVACIETVSPVHRL